MDIGCSSGSFLAAAESLGVNAEGVEPSSAPVQTAKKHGLKVHNGLLEDTEFPYESFDVLTLFELIEHLKDPLSLIQECRRILRPGGILVIRTGNTYSWTVKTMRERWEYFDIYNHGGHISFFNPSSMRHLALKSGFTIEDIKTRRISFCNKALRF